MSVRITSHIPEVQSSVDSAFNRAAEIIGGMAESYAKGLAPYKTGNLRNSITHDRENNGHAVVIGSSVKYAPYQELGAPNAHVPAHPYLRPAFENHMDEYKRVLEGELAKIK
jgi:HK97 gp10 family phage protein